MSDSTIEPLPDGDGKLGNAEGPADSGAGQSGMPGEHDGGADGGAAGGAEGPADSGAGEPSRARRARRRSRRRRRGPGRQRRGRALASPVSTTAEPTAGPTPRSDDSSPGAARGPLLPGGGPRVVRAGRGRPRHLRAAVLGPRAPAHPGGRPPARPRAVRPRRRRRAALPARPAHAVPADGARRPDARRLDLHPGRRRGRRHRRPGERRQGAAPVRRRARRSCSRPCTAPGPPSPTRPGTSPPTSATRCRSTPTSPRPRAGASTTTTTCTTCSWSRWPARSTGRCARPWSSRRCATSPGPTTGMPCASRPRGRRRSTRCSPPATASTCPAAGCTPPRRWAAPASTSRWACTSGPGASSPTTCCGPPAAASTPTRRCGPPSSWASTRSTRRATAHLHTGIRAAVVAALDEVTDDELAAALAQRVRGAQRAEPIDVLAQHAASADGDTVWRPRRHLAPRWEDGPGPGVSTLVTRVARVEVPNDQRDGRHRGPRPPGGCRGPRPRRAPIALSRRPARARGPTS